MKMLPWHSLVHVVAPIVLLEFLLELQELLITWVRCHYVGERQCVFNLVFALNCLLASHLVVLSEGL
jgi:hypothetical protein